MSMKLRVQSSEAQCQSLAGHLRYVTSSAERHLGGTLLFNLYVYKKSNHNLNEISAACVQGSKVHNHEYSIKKLDRKQVEVNLIEASLSFTYTIGLLKNASERIDHRF